MKTTSIKNIKTKKGIGAKRVENLKKAIKNRDRRLTSWTKRMYPEEGKTLVERYQALARGQYLPGKISIDFDKITTVKDYNALMRMLTSDKSKAFKLERTFQMREWLKKSIDKSLMLTRELDPELYARIDKMTDTEILEFRLENPSLISRVFEYYSDEAYITVEERNYLWDTIRVKLGLPILENKSMSMVLM